MKKNAKSFINNIFFTIIIMLISFLLSLLIQHFFDAQPLIPSIYVLSVFIISRFTDGYIYGILSALFSVLAVNFAFTFPFFKFDFTVHENLVSAIIMIIVTLGTSTLTTKIKNQEALKAESDIEKMRANLLRAISHDIRTPLTSIYGASSTIIENYTCLNDSDKLEMLEGIKEDSQWLIQIVENLLSITKINSGDIKLVKSSTVLEELIDSTLEKFKKKYPSCNIDLSIPDDFIIISADAILIEQVLLNLLENAAIHAKGMTVLKLKVSIENSKAIFEIIDDGCGIDKERLKNIFTGGINSSNMPDDSKKRSMGIGLSVCSSIIKAHGSEIIAKNIKNGGMIFKFSLDTEDSSYE